MGKGKPSEIWKEIKPRIGDMVTAANDMEQSFDKAVREAYENGYLDAAHNYHEMCDFLDDEKKDAYQRGLNDAWEAARKIASDNAGQNYSIFGQHFTVEILSTHSASEALEEIRAHEQAQKEKEEEKSISAEDVMRQYLDTFCKHNFCTECLLHTPDFTCGRGYHFLTSSRISDEEVRRAYAEILAKMKE